MTHNPLNAQRRRLRWKISLVYSLPLLFAALVLVFIFYTSVKNMLMISSYKATETVLQDKVVNEIDASLENYKNAFMNVARRVQQNMPKEAQSRAVMSRHYQGNDAILDVYYGNVSGEFISGRGTKLSSENAEIRTKAWYLEASRRRGLAFSGPTLRNDIKKNVMTISYPIWDKNRKFRGAVAEDLDLHKIRVAMGNLARDEGGITALISMENDNLFTYFPYETSRGKVVQDTVSELLQLISGQFQPDSLTPGVICRIVQANQQHQNMVFMISPLKNSPFYVVHVMHQNKVLA